MDINPSSEALFCQKTKSPLLEYWSDFYGDELDDTQFYQYRNRLKSFLELLVRIEKRRKGEKENDTRT